MGTNGGQGTLHQFPLNLLPMPCSSGTFLPSSSTSLGSFVWRESTHNRHRFVGARHNLSQPYPSLEDVYLRSNSMSIELWTNTSSNLLWISLDPYEEEFSDIGLSDFIIAHKRVARRKLECLELTPFQSSLLLRGVQQRMDDQEPKGI